MSDKSMRDASFTLAGFRATGFASPAGQIDDELLNVIVGEHARSVTRAFLGSHRAPLAAGSPGLADVLDQFVAGDPTFDTAWDLAVGPVGATARGPWNVRSQVAAAEFALHLHTRDAAGTWESTF